MLGKLGLALVLVLSGSVARSMPGAVPVDISPTVPDASDSIDLRSDRAKPVHPVTRQVAPLPREKYVP